MKNKNIQLILIAMRAESIVGNFQFVMGQRIRRKK